MSTLWHWFQGLAFAMSGMLAFSTNSALAQITPDATLPNNSRVTLQGNTRIIEGGTTSGSNLFHSFKEFSVPTGWTADFQNTSNIQNIITRVTGNSISNIDGTLRANGTANLFLINPNGIIFGPNASLNIRGSFIGTTASSVNFADNIKFSATEPETKPLLTVNVPIGLQFGATAAPIHNQSQASLDGATNIFEQAAGLQVPTGKTIALIGGDLTLEGGNLTASEGRIELGSVDANSLVSLNPNDQGWTLGYEGVQNFQNIQLIRRNVNGSLVPSIADAGGESGGDIQVQGNSVELIGGGVFLRTATKGIRDGGELTITARKLVIRDGAQVLSVTLGQGAGGDVNINASDSVELTGSFTDNDLGNFLPLPSVLSSETWADGKAGDININTTKLRVNGGARVTAASEGLFISSQFIPGNGSGGNLTVNASESVELTGTSTTGDSSRLITLSNRSSGDAGNLKIATKQLIVRDGAEIDLSSQNSDLPENATLLGDINNLGKAGSLTVDANSILLDKGTISANTLGGGGNISLNSPLSILRNGSNITTNATGTNIAGGNINIDAKNGFIIANENSDITANSENFRGGNISILNAQGIFGIQPRNSLTPNSDITATGATSALSGTVEIEPPDEDPDRDSLEVDLNLVDASKLINRNFCALRGKSSFIITGRGGLQPSPNSVLDSQSLWEDWRFNPVPREVLEDKDKKEKTQNNIAVNKPVNQIVQANRAVINSKGEVMLVADAGTPPNPENLASGCG